MMTESKELYRSSAVFGMGLGAWMGALLGAAAGAITVSWNGVLVGAGVGLTLGILTGALTGLATAKTAGATGGVSFGAYTGMGLGAVIGAILGALIPDAWRMAVNTQHTPVLDALTQGRFETAVLICFALSILGTAVGAWVSGRNFIPRDVKA
jgi:MFS family permease